uniref:Ig-like domain-containing protein n=1 Tax=Cyprinus carpio TaxID=7962 RepID=A0A8C2CYY0_CYPCA
TQNKKRDLSNVYLTQKMKCNRDINLYLIYTFFGGLCLLILKHHTPLKETCLCSLLSNSFDVFPGLEQPKITLRSARQAGGSRPAVLVCSAYEFYPKKIKVSWLRDGKEMTSDVTSTMEMADGNWFYQIHSELEYTPKSGEKISCVVEHASFSKPMIYDWDPSLPEGERNKIAIGASGLVLGIIIAAAGLIYYKKKSAGQFR